MQSSSQRWIPYILIILAALILSAPLIFTGQALYWGTPGLQFMPWREYAFAALRQGQLPLWNPLVGMGAPLLANYQAALLYPPNWLLFMLSSLGGIEWHAWGQMVLVGLHWALAGVGTARLAGRLGLGPLAQALSGLGYGLGAYMVSRAGFLSINAAAAWLPWIVDYAGRLATPALRQGDRRSATWLKLAAVAALQLLAGHAQTAWYTAVLAFLWGGYWAWVAPDSPADSSSRSRMPFLLRLRSAGLACLLLAGAYLLASGLAGAQLIPTAEYLLQSQRSEAFEFETAMTYSYWPWRLITLLAPAFFGSPVSGDYWGYGNYWEDAVYIGLLPVLLALAAVLGWLRQVLRGRAVPGAPRPASPAQDLRSKAIPFLFFISLLSFTLAFGKNTPIFPWLYQNVPTFDMFQAPSRFTLWAALALPLLAGFGAQTWHRPEGRALYWTRLGTAGAAAVTIGAVLAWQLMGEVSPTFIRALALAGLLGVLAGGLSLLAPRAGQVDPGHTLKENNQGYLWQLGVALFVLGDLLAAGWGLNPGIDTGFYREGVGAAAALPQLLAGRRLYLSPSDEYTLKFDRFFLFDSFTGEDDPHQARQVALPNLHMLDGIASMNNFDPLLPGRYDTWMETLDHAPEAGRELMLDMSGAGMVERLAPAAQGGVSLNSLPGQVGRRARWLPCGRAVEGDTEMLRLISRGELDVDKEVLLDANEAGMAGLECSDPISQGRVELIEEKPDRLVARVSSTAPGWLLLSDTWFPGWIALIDGEEQQVYRGNYLFRAVFLDAGEHEVVFRYQPASFMAGLAASLASVLCFSALVIWARRKPAQVTSTESDARSKPATEPIEIQG